MLRSSSNTPVRTGTWGSADGTQMELYVTWTELGLAPNSPFSFHVSSSNASLTASSFTAQIDDNLAGCGGGPGIIRQVGARFTPDLALTGFVGQSVTGVHTLTNIGNANDRFNIETVVSGAFSPAYALYVDVDGSGSLTAADTPLTDSNADGIVDSGWLLPGETITVLIVYDIPLSAGAGAVATVQSIATSEVQPLANDSVTDTITAAIGPEFVISKAVTTLSDPVNLTSNPKAIPGGVVEYRVVVENQGAGTADADSFALLDAIPSGGCLIVSDIDGAGSGPVSFEDGVASSGLAYSFVALGDPGDDVAFSADNGTTFGYAPSPDASGCDSAITHIRISPSGIFAVDTGTGVPSASFEFRMLVN